MTPTVPDPQPRPQGLLLATAVPLAAALVALGNPGPLLLAAVAVAVWYGGRRFGLVTTAAILAFALLPRAAFPSRPVPTETVINFAVVALLINGLTGALQVARRRAEADAAALRASHERYELAARGSRDGLWDWDVRTGRLQFSARLEGLVGPPGDGPRDLIGALAPEMHPKDLRRVQTTLREHLERRAPFDVEFRLRGPGGRYRWLHARGQADWGADGRPTRMAGSLGDVTRRKRAEVRLRTLVEALPQIVWTARADGTIDSYNSRWSEYTGLTRRQSLRAGWHPAVHTDDLSTSLRGWEEAVRAGQTYVAEERLRRADGAYRWHLVRAVPLRDGAGRVVRWFGTCTDIDDRKRAEQATEADSRAKDRFLAMLSHELRTPLTPSLLAISGLLEDAETPAGLRGSLEVARRGIELEARLVDELLDVTRAAAGKLGLRTEWIDAHAAVRQALDACAGDLQAAGLRLELDLSAALHHVEADPARLQQVVWNLVKNATKFTPPGGTVAVRSRNVADCDCGGDGRTCLVVEVTDTGVGIDPELLPRIFEVFEQGDRWRQRRSGGLGLGLAIARAIAEAHGGSLTATSDGPGRGSRFALELPAARASTPRPAATAPAADGPGGHGLRILLVEDDQATSQVLSRLLRRHGSDVTTAATLAEARAAGESASFDLLVSDLGLPDGTGLDLMRWLKARCRTPGIALSGYGSEEDMRESRAAGFAAHLIKPVDFATLETTIRRIAAGEGALVGPEVLN
jgi:PAS domain S-box-containing protein